MNIQNKKGLKHFVIQDVLIVRGVCCSLAARKCDSFHFIVRENVLKNKKQIYTFSL